MSNLHCPQSEQALGFIDKNSRTDHQLHCFYRSGESHHNPKENTNLSADIIPWYEEALISPQMLSSAIASTLEVLCGTDSGSKMEDDPSYWVNEIEDLLLDGAFGYRGSENLDLIQSSL